MELTKRDLYVISYLLEIAGEVFSDHGCNDMPIDMYEGWSEEEKERLSNNFHEWNGDANYLEREEKDVDCLVDHALMGFYSAKLKELSK